MTSSIQRFTRYVSLPWPPQGQPYLELNAYVAFLGAAVVLMPFFVILALMKVGNYANDGHKLGHQESEMVLYQNVRPNRYCRWLKCVWRHGGPLAPLIHLAASMCLLLPRLLVEAQLIKHGFLSKGGVWKTDLDFLIAPKDRLVRVRFLETLNATEVWGQQADPTLRRPELQNEEHAGVSMEFLNYCLALLVFAIRYPAVYWNANKNYGFIFTFYLLVTAIQQLVAFAGFSILYKVHICGPRDVLLRFSTLFLSVQLTVLLFFLYNFLLTISSSILYCYGLQKYNEWCDRRLESQLIRWKQESRRLWGITPHLMAFLFLIATALCAAPLMYDLTLIYCGSLDGIVLSGITGTLIHLFLWIVLWLVLIIKHKWVFMSLNSRGNSPISAFKGSGQEPPLLVIDHGQTYQVREKESKKAILNIIHKSFASLPKLSPTEDDDIYWLKPKPPSPKDGTSTWHKSQRKSPALKHKVIFQDSKRSFKKSPKVSGRLKKANVQFEQLSDSDDGDYATLRDMTVVRQERTKRLRPPHGNEAILKDDEAVEVTPFLPPLEEVRVETLPNDEMAHLKVPVHSISSRRTDSGVSRSDIVDLSPRSESESSTSPEKGSSESSSGVHSNASLENKRAASLENVGFITLPNPPWKSLSLQRSPPQLANIVHRHSQHSSTPKPFERATNVRLTSFTEQSTEQSVVHERRDSANYSLTSSAESESSVHPS